MTDITLVGVSHVPAVDGGSVSLINFSAPPPAGMQEGDYVVAVFHVASSGVTLSITNTGGQTWVEESQIAVPGGSTHVRVFHCRFNGTWDANPVFSHNLESGRAGLLHISVWRNVDETTALDAPYTSEPFAAPSSPYHVTRPEIVTQTDGAVALAIWNSRDNNSWALVTPGWTNVNGETQWRDSSISSISMAWKKVTPAGGSGAVVNRQSALGGDPGVTHILALRPASTPGVVGVAGLGAASALGSVAAFSDVTFTLTGLSGTGSVGSVSVDDTIHGVSGLEASPQLGSATVDIVHPNASSSPSGISTETGVGSVTVTILSPNITVTPTGVSDNARVGTVLVTSTALAVVAGLSTVLIVNPVIASSFETPLTADDFDLYLSGGAANTDGNLSLGGAKSSTKVGALGNLFDDVSAGEVTAGDVEYRCVYLTNDHIFKSLTNVQLWIESQTASPRTRIQLGLGGTNTTEPSIANEGIAPAGVTFVDAPDHDPLLIPDLAPGEYQAVWIKRQVVKLAASNPKPQDYAVLRVLVA